MKEFLHGGKGTVAGEQRAGTEPSTVEREIDVVAPAGDEISSEELREFLEADRLGVRADPAFRERLREALWELLRRVRGNRSDRA